MKNMKLAVCIPTYNRSEVVNEFIEKYASIYIQHGFDIFFYDSSENSQTEVVVKEWMSQYFALHYVKIDSTIHSNMKVYNIFREFGSSEEYDYLWVCSDSIRWSERALDAVSDCIRQGYDIIVPNYRDVEKIGNREYHDKNTFFEDCAWHMTLYGATILKVSTMLKEVHWEALIEKYCVPECINHSHVAFYFEKLSELKNWKAVHLSLDKGDLTASQLKKHPGWQKDTFYVWCHCWPTMIHKLPDCYKKKSKVIKQSGINSEILTYPYLKNLRHQEILDLEVYNLYKKEWHHLTNLPRSIIWFLAALPPYMVVYLNQKFCWRMVKDILLKKRLRQFCGEYSRIYIYGAGKKAIRYTRYLDAMGIHFEAYLVSECSKAVGGMNDHKVMVFCSDLLDDGKSGILLALNEENTKEVLRDALKSVDRRFLFSEFKIRCEG